MKLKLNTLLPLALFFIIVGFLAKGLYLDPHEVPSPLIGKTAPAFQAPDLYDATRTFSTADMKGKVWLLNVWASWCAACREEHPVLMQMRQLNIPLYGLAYKDTDAESQAVLKENGNPYIAIATDANGKIGIDYGVYGVPETYVIDKAGVIRYKQIGPITPKNLREKIMPLLETLQK